ncbi:MAG TPA: hypothetical protein VK973_00560 [Arenicellales bacterium]|nr:hypothetical protein [Arenicellales bacterium]
MRTRSWQRLLTAWFALAAIATAGLIHSGGGVTLVETASSQDCDCSCEGFAGIRDRMRELEDAVQSGGAAAMTPELQQLAACAGQCAMQWAQCERDAASGSRNDAAGSSEPGEPDSEPRGEAQADVSDVLGEPRDDLARFHGVYGDGSGRDFFVAEAARPEYAEQQLPRGYLMIGAMWGDVAPWYMQSVSETRFEQQWVNPGGEPIVARFEIDDDGNARALVFETVFADRGALPRTGDLPEGW